MPLIDNPTSAHLERVLKFYNHRHDVIASNVANANTPGYRAFDLEFRKQVEGGGRLEALRTDPRHLSLDPAMSRISGDLERSEAPARLDGNNVSMEEELMKMLENRVRYEVAIELYDRWGGLMPIARDTQ